MRAASPTEIQTSGAVILTLDRRFSTRAAAMGSPPQVGPMHVEAQKGRKMYTMPVVSLQEFRSSGMPDTQVLDIEVDRVLNKLVFGGKLAAGRSYSKGDLTILRAEVEDHEPARVGFRLSLWESGAWLVVTFVEEAGHVGDLTELVGFAPAEPSEEDREALARALGLVR